MRPFLSRIRSPRRVSSIGTAFLLLLFAGVVPAAEQLTVRVNDAVAEPGGTIAIVLRTYASRPIGQGQLCMVAAASPLGPGGPLDTLLSSTVFATLPDVTTQSTAHLLLDPQAIVVQFESPSATINATDGPLAVFHLQLSETLLPGQTFELAIDAANSSLTDENGQPIAILPRSGQLTIRAPGDPISVLAHAEDTAPGGDARLSLETVETFGISSGRVGIRYDAALAAGTPVVSMNPRHGTASFTTDLSTPGLAIVNFESADGSLNLVPGALVDVSVPTLPSVPPGTLSLVSLDEQLTFLLDTTGANVELVFAEDLLEFGDSLTGKPGEAPDLMVTRMSGDLLRLNWVPDCGDGTTYAIYRGDLSLGYDSIAPVPGFCAVGGTSVLIPQGAGTSDFFLVVPHLNNLEGSYGTTSAHDSRSAAFSACFPEGDDNDCTP